jgi:uncharacterized protein with ParB-like and HNH nuclease domain
VASRFGHHPWTVQELVIGVDKGTIRLPDIQRPFVWPNAKVRDLIDSMYRGYPVGELMFWTNNDHEHTKAIGHAAKTQAASYQVVDGQQRLTSLYSVLRGLAGRLQPREDCHRFQPTNRAVRGADSGVREVSGVDPRRRWRVR